MTDNPEVIDSQFLVCRLFGSWQAASENVAVAAVILGNRR